MTFETILIIILLLLIAFGAGFYLGYRFGKRYLDDPST